MEETIDMRLGTAVHSFILEGKKPEYVLRPEFVPGTTDKWHGAKKECKEWLTAQTLPVLTQDEEDRQMRMINALLQDKRAIRLLELCNLREVPVFTEYQGLPFKCRLDAFMLTDGHRPIIMDLKKTTSAKPRDFRNKVLYDFHYDMQAQVYRNLVALKYGMDEPPDYIWCVVEDSKAAHVQLFGMSEEIEKSGQDKLQKSVDAYKSCIENNEWPGYEYWSDSANEDGIIIL